MSAQAVYDQYVESFGYSPKTADHLVAFSKKQGSPIPYSDAREIINNIKQMGNEIVSKVPAPTIRSESAK